MIDEKRQATAVKRNTLLYFVKFPEPGKVKTRLAQTVGVEEAALAYRNLAIANLSILTRLDQKAISIVITFDPAGKEAEVKSWLCGDFSYVPQQGSGLGERLQNAFQCAFQNGSEKVIALGSDTLGLSSCVVQESFDRLDESDVVIGPAKDGGYYLIGLKKGVPELFHNIPWSTSGVLETTLHKVKLKELCYGILTELEDLDELGIEKSKGGHLNEILKV